MTDREPIYAIWSLELNCHCPECGHYVNLLCHPDFWDGRDIQVCEYGTLKTTGMEVCCPVCGAEFEVDCMY